VDHQMMLILVRLINLILVTRSNNSSLGCQKRPFAIFRSFIFFIEYYLGDVYEAVYSYEATDPSDLSFDVGDRIIVLKRDDDWWTGQIGDRIGTFPNNYVQKVEHIQETAIAITPFEATEEDRLSFEQGQTIHITKKDENGWYQGEIRVYYLFVHCSFNIFFLKSFLINQYVLVGFQLIVYKYKQPLHIKTNQVNRAAILFTAVQSIRFFYRMPAIHGDISI